MLESDRKIERDKGIKLLEESLQLNQLFEFTTIIDLEIEKLKESSEIDWKKTHALLSSLKIIISKASDLFGIKKYIPWVVKQLEHAEFRVRLESGAVIEEMARFDSSKTHEATIQKILELIQINLKRQNEAVAKETYFGINETEKLFHDTSGWKYLESSMKALQSLIKGCGITYVDLISLDDVDILIECSKHTNRFVRETSMYVFETLFEINVTPFLRNNNKIAYVIDSLIQCLSDNWSQDISDTNVFRLLPPVCLNRHYLAEGVKLYNVNTWKIITKNEGLKIVSANIDQFITFYVSQSKADNHAVREAACHCLAELGYLLGQMKAGLFETLPAMLLVYMYPPILFSFKNS
ncbi:hypothetical protein MXB_5001 [Myxobolus squamalis]|nr:hypothetical protein MXB_5001 [Myxobolus squamalis]